MPLSQFGKLTLTDYPFAVMYLAREKRVKHFYWEFYSLFFDLSLDGGQREKVTLVIDLVSVEYDVLIHFRKLLVSLLVSLENIGHL